MTKVARNVIPGQSQRIGGIHGSDFHLTLSRNGFQSLLEERGRRGPPLRVFVNQSISCDKYGAYLSRDRIQLLQNNVSLMRLRIGHALGPRERVKREIVQSGPTRIFCRLCGALKPKGLDFMDDGALMYLLLRQAMIHLIGLPLASASLPDRKDTPIHDLTTVRHV